jgi:hypothetical protein
VYSNFVIKILLFTLFFILNFKNEEFCTSFWSVVSIKCGLESGTNCKRLDATSRETSDAFAESRRIMSLTKFSMQPTLHVRNLLRNKI